MLDIFDRDVLTRALADVTTWDATEVLASLTGDTADAVAEIAALCSFDHCGVLVFPDDPGNVVAFLTDLGLTVGSLGPSIVVRQRLARRYHRDPAELDVSVVRATIDTSPGVSVGLEVFCLPRSLAGETLIAGERVQRNEFHMTLLVNDANALTMQGLRAALLDRFECAPDGGGYNSFDGEDTGGRSVLFFRMAYGRLGLTCTGKPDLAQTFDSAMAAVTGRMAARVGSAYTFAPGSTVVDLGGGNGALLRVVLRANPTVRGILMDTARVLSRLPAESDLAGRLMPLCGDFFESVPAGHDVYLLSRVLHDWPDEECVRILQSCRAACRPDSTLLVVERLLSEEDSDPLAHAWDMQMLAIAGGGERALPDYERLMAKGDFTIREIRDLSPDLKLFVCAPLGAIS